MEIKLNKREGNYPKLISQEVIDLILADIKRGSPNKYAAEANGVSEVLFYYWIKQGLLDLTYGLDTIHSRLVKSLRGIEQEEIVECRSAIKESDKGHRGAEWTLEHVYWRQFSSNAPAIDLNERMERLELGELASPKEPESNSQGEVQ